MTRTRGPWRPLVGIGSIVAASAAAAAAALLAHPPEPATLAAPRQNVTVPVTERAFDDRHQTELIVAPGPSRSVTSPRTGRLTAFDCAAGAVLLSGSAPLAIDGRRLIALATGAPLWRSLASGDRGDDVLAVQSELTRLGYPTEQDGVMGRATFRALAALRSDLRLPAAADPILDLSDVVWLPQAEVAVDQCAGVLGTNVGSGDELIRLPVRAVSARLSTVPVPRVPGPRSITVGSVTVPVGDDGAVTSEASLDGLSSLPEFAAAAQKGGAASVPASWALSTPVTVQVVPPVALWDMKDGAACIQPARGRPVLVRVLGSDLGQSFVSVGEGGELGDVVVSPRKTRTCR